jgi:nucleotide-binding universal stress UspA family protein
LDGQVLVGFDGSDNARDAIRFGHLLASSLATGFEAVHVRSRPGGDDDAAASEERIDLADGGPGLELRHVGATSAAAGLFAVAEAEDPALLVVGATHQRGVGKLLHRSVAGRLASGLPCPLVIVPAGYVAQGRIRVLEVGFDSAPESRAALAMAATLGKAANATLRVVAAGDVTAPVLAGELQQQLHDVVADLPAELRTLPIYAQRDAAAELLDRAAEGVDLIVLGSRGYGPVRAVLLGSVSATVIERAPCPVLIVPRGGDGG